MRNSIRLLIVIAALLLAPTAMAAIDNQDIAEGISQTFLDAAGGWASTILKYATYLFWSLATISLSWTFGVMAVQKADFQEFAAEFIKFVITTSFFFWLLVNGPTFGKAIIDGLRQMGAEASGLPPTFHPGNVLDIGFHIFNKVLDNLGTFSLASNIAGIVLGALVLVILALISANMMILLCSAWILLYAGVFFLGFGGGRWTTDIAINYYKTVLGVAASLFTMVLIIGIGSSIIEQYYANMSDELNLKELAVMGMVVVILFLLVDKVPPMVAGVINGSSVGGPGGIGGFGAGMAVGAAGVAAAATGVAGGMAAGLAKEGAGAGSAVAAAVGQSTENMKTGGGLFGEYNQSAPGVSTPRSLGGVFDKGATFIADVGKNIGSGASDTMKQGMANRAEQMKDSISQTTGGKVANSIKGKGGAGPES